MRTSGSQAFQFFQIARYAGLLLASILLSKSGMDTGAIGHYESFVLVSGTLSFFWVNGLLNAFLTLFHKVKNTAASIMQTAVFLAGTSLLLITLLSIFRVPVSAFFHFEESGNMYLLFLLFFLVNNLAFLTEYILLARERTKALIALGIFHLLVQTTLIALPAYTSGDYTLVLKGLTAFALLKCCITLFLVLQTKNKKLDPSVMRSHLRLAWPLIVSFFLGGMSIYVDGIIVNHFYDKGIFATYQYGAREFPISLLLANAFSASVALKISADAKDLDYVRTGSLRMMHRLFPICMLLLIISPRLYPLVFNPAFADSYLFFNIYILLLIPRLIFPHSILTGMGNTAPVMYASMLEFMLNIVCSILFMQYFGLQGIAYGTVVSFSMNKILLSLYLRRKGMHISSFIPVRAFLSYSFALILVFIVFTYFYHA
ncbi:MAG: polysaccharide biosynthesis C-terminal domain-containing protein [Chitinophagales bacterium]